MMLYTKATTATIIEICNNCDPFFSSYFLYLILQMILPTPSNGIITDVTIKIHAHTFRAFPVFFKCSILLLITITITVYSHCYSHYMKFPFIFI